MVWVLVMWLDFEWAVGAFDGKSPPATCWAAISAHYCINVEPYHIIHAVCPRMCWLLCQILVFAIRLDSTKNPAPSAEVVFPNLNNPPCILLPMSLAMQSHHTKRKRFRCFLLHCLNCVLYQPVAKKWNTNGGIIMLRPNFLFLYLLLIVVLFLLLSIDMIHCCVPHLLVLVCCMWWWGGGAERELKRNSKQMGVAWKWSAPIYYYFICCWLLHCFSSCQLIRSIVVCPTSIAPVISSKIVLTIFSTPRWKRCGFSSAIFCISSDRIIGVNPPKVFSSNCSTYSRAPENYRG